MTIPDDASASIGTELGLQTASLVDLGPMASKASPTSSVRERQHTVAYVLGA
jgi:hypothetical protein